MDRLRSVDATLSSGAPSPAASPSSHRAGVGEEKTHTTPGAHAVGSQGNTDSSSSSSGGGSSSHAPASTTAAYDNEVAALMRTYAQGQTTAAAAAVAAASSSSTALSLPSTVTTTPSPAAPAPSPDSALYRTGSAHGGRSSRSESLVHLVSDEEYARHARAQSANQLVGLIDPAPAALQAKRSNTAMGNRKGTSGDPHSDNDSNNDSNSNSVSLSDAQHDGRAHGGGAGSLPVTPFAGEREHPSPHESPSPLPPTVHAAPLSHSLPDTPPHITAATPAASHPAIASFSLAQSSPALSVPSVPLAVAEQTADSAWAPTETRTPALSVSAAAGPSASDPSLSLPPWAPAPPSASPASLVAAPPRHISAIELSPITVRLHPCDSDSTEPAERVKRRSSSRKLKQNQWRDSQETLAVNTEDACEVALTHMPSPTASSKLPLKSTPAPVSAGGVVAPPPSSPPPPRRRKGCRCSLPVLITSISLLEVVIAAFLVWLLGYLSLLDAVEDMADSIRNTVLDSCLAQLNRRFSEPVQAAAALTFLTRLRYGSSWPHSLSTYSNQTGWLADLSHLSTQYPGLQSMGLGNSRGALQVLTKLSREQTSFLDRPSGDRIMPLSARDLVVDGVVHLELEGSQYTFIEPLPGVRRGDSPLLSYLIPSNRSAIPNASGASDAGTPLYDEQGRPVGFHSRLEPDIKPESTAEQIRTYLGTPEILSGSGIFVDEPFHCAYQMLEAAARMGRPMDSQVGWTEPMHVMTYGARSRVGTIASVHTVVSDPIDPSLRPLNMSGEYDAVSFGVTYAMLNLDSLNTLMRTFPLRKHGVIFVFDTNGQVLASSRAQDVIIKRRNNSTTLRTDAVGSAAGWVDDLQAQLRRWGLIAPIGMTLTPFNASAVLSPSVRTPTFRTDTKLTHSDSGRHHVFTVQARMLNANDTNALPFTVVLVTRTQDFTDSANTNLMHTGLLSIGVLLATALLSCLLARYATAPLRTICGAMERLSELSSGQRGTLEHRQQMLMLLNEWDSNKEMDKRGHVVDKHTGKGDTKSSRSGAHVATASSHTGASNSLTDERAHEGPVPISGSSPSPDTRLAIRPSTPTPTPTPATPNATSSSCAPLSILSALDFASQLYEVDMLRRAFGSMLYSLASYDELEAINQSKRSFIRYIFHEVRVPFNAIVLGIEQLHTQQKQIVHYLHNQRDAPDGGLLHPRAHSSSFVACDDDESGALCGALAPPAGFSSEEQQHTMEVLDILAEQSQIVSRILNDVLSMQKIEDGALELSYELFRLEPLLRNCLNTFRSACMDKRIRLRIRFTRLNSAIAAQLPGALLGVRRDRHTQVIWSDDMIRAEQERRSWRRQSGNRSARSTGTGRGSARHTGKSPLPFDRRWSGAASAAGASGESSARSSGSGVPSVRIHEGDESSLPIQPLALSLLVNQAYVRGDSYRLRQVIANLVSNAIKFSPNKSTVRVALEVKSFEPDPEAMRYFGAEAVARIRAEAAKASVAETEAAASARSSTPPYSRPVDNARAARTNSCEDDQRLAAPSQISAGALHTLESSGVPLSHAEIVATPCDEDEKQHAAHQRLPLGISTSSTTRVAEQATVSPSPLAAQFACAPPSSTAAAPSSSPSPSPSLSSPPLPSRLGVAMVRLSVRDHGIGLSAQDMKSLFQEYVQIDANRSQKGGGTGLGLAISKSIVAMHGGTIGVRANADALADAAKTLAAANAKTAADSMPQPSPSAPYTPFSTHANGEQGAASPQAHPTATSTSPNQSPSPALASGGHSSPAAPVRAASSAGVHAPASSQTAPVASRGCEFWVELPLEVFWRAEEVSLADLLSSTLTGRHGLGQATKGGVTTLLGGPASQHESASLHNFAMSGVGGGVGSGDNYSSSELHMSTNQPPATVGRSLHDDALLRSFRSDGGHGSGSLPRQRANTMHVSSSDESNSNGGGTSGSDSAMMMGALERAAALRHHVSVAGTRGVKSASGGSSLQPSPEQRQRDGSLLLAAPSSSPGAASSPDGAGATFSPPLSHRRRHGAHLNHSRQLSISMEEGLALAAMAKESAEGSGGSSGTPARLRDAGLPPQPLSASALSQRLTPQTPAQMLSARSATGSASSTPPQRRSSFTVSEAPILAPSVGSSTMLGARASTQHRQLNLSGWSDGPATPAEDLRGTLDRLDRMPAPKRRLSGVGMSPPLAQAGAGVGITGIDLLPSVRSSSGDHAVFTSASASASPPPPTHPLPPYSSQNPPQTTPMPTRRLAATAMPKRATPPLLTRSTSTVRPGTRVLVVEDSHPNRKLLMSLLVVLKCKATGVENGQECVDLFPEELNDSAHIHAHRLSESGGAPAEAAAAAAQTQAEDASLLAREEDAALALTDTAHLPFDVVLMDGTMPVMNGIVATRFLRDRGFSNLVIIAVTGNALEEDVNAFMRAGVQEVLTKPISKAKLEAALSKYCPAHMQAQGHTGERR